MGLRRYGFVLGLLAMSGRATAAEVDFDGFFSVGAGVIDASDAEYLGYRDEFSLDSLRSDGVLGLQLTSAFTEQFSVTGQLIMRGYDDYKPVLEWGYASYEFTDALTVRGGRMRVPFFLVSEYLEVGFAYPWIRPPQEVYKVMPFTTFDGLDINYTRHLGEGELNFQSYYGNNSDDLFIDFNAPDIPSKTKDLIGLVVSYNRDWLTLRASQHRADVSIELAEFTPFIAALRQAGLTQTASDLEIKNTAGRFSELGVQIDYQQFLLIAEATELRWDRSLNQDRDSWYATLGYRLNDDHLLHTTYAKHRTQLRDMTTTLPPPLQLPQAACRQFPQAPSCIINLAVSQQDKSQHSIGLGWRWNVSESAALKLEWQRIHADQGSDGLLESGRPDQQLNLYSVVLDLVF